MIANLIIFASGMFFGWLFTRVSPNVKFYGEGYRKGFDAGAEEMAHQIQKRVREAKFEQEKARMN